MELKQFNIGIVGGTSLLAGLLIPLLLKHKSVNLLYIDSEHSENEFIAPFHKIEHPFLENKRFQKYAPEFIKKNLDLVFIAKSHGDSMKYVKELYNDKLKIIDLSGDFRIHNVPVYEKYYKMKHIAPELIQKSIYGLAEINYNKIKNSILLANPGCYPTGIILALYPLIKEKVIDPTLCYIDSYSGVSGAGRNPIPGKNLFLDAFNNIITYKINSHQHIPEIEQELSLIHEQEIKINLVPHIASMDNGILNTIFVKVIKAMDQKQLLDIFKKTYTKSKFIKILDKEPPQIKEVINSNYCMIYPLLEERTNSIIVSSVIDNRIKGGVGQAIQNMNIMFGLPEENGLLDC